MYQFWTLLTRLLILCSSVFIFPYTFSCLKTCSTNMSNPCMNCAKKICHECGMALIPPLLINRLRNI